MIRLETERLIIRDHEEKDIDELHSLLSDKKAMYYIPDLQTSTLDESKLNLYEAIKEAHLDNRTKYFFAITIKETNEYVGEIGYTVAIDSSWGKVVHLGYFTLEKFWGKGITSEAAKAVIDFAFTKGEAIKIETGCIKDNIGSEKVMIKNGMIKEAEFKKHVYVQSKLFDRVEYRLLKEEWELLRSKDQER